LAVNGERAKPAGESKAFLKQKGCLSMSAMTRYLRTTHQRLFLCCAALLAIGLGASGCGAGDESNDCAGCWNKSEGDGVCQAASSLEPVSSDVITVRAIEFWADELCLPLVEDVSMAQIRAVCENTSGLTCSDPYFASWVTISSEAAWNAWNALCGLDFRPLAGADWAKTQVVFAQNGFMGGCGSGNCAESEFGVGLLPSGEAQIDLAVWDACVGDGGDKNCDGLYYVAAGVVVTTDKAVQVCTHGQPCPNTCP
jgi:hypothetical protein